MADSYSLFCSVVMVSSRTLNRPEIFSGFYFHASSKIAPLDQIPVSIFNAKTKEAGEKNQFWSSPISLGCARAPILPCDDINPIVSQWRIYRQAMCKINTRFISLPCVCAEIRAFDLTSRMI